MYIALRKQIFFFDKIIMLSLQYMLFVTVLKAWEIVKSLTISNKKYIVFMLLWNSRPPRLDQMPGHTVGCLYKSGGSRNRRYLQSQTDHESWFLDWSYFWTIVRILQIETKLSSANCIVNCFNTKGVLKCFKWRLNLAPTNGIVKCFNTKGMMSYIC